MGWRLASWGLLSAILAPLVWSWIRQFVESIHSVGSRKDRLCQQLGMFCGRTRSDSLDENLQECHLTYAVHTSRPQCIPSIEDTLCFQFNGKIYYYKNCPFGAVVSAHFWARLGGVFQRLFHRICYLPHAAFIYVDDMLFFQESQIIGLSAAVIAILCVLTGLPISWKKCELGATIIWIGWFVVL